MLIDTHAHILPGIDDGARDESATRSLLESLAKQKVKVAVATPHFYPQRESLTSFLNRRQHSVQRLLAMPEITETKSFASYKGEFGGIKLYLGAECFLTPALLRFNSLEDLCIGSNRHILIEMPFTTNWNRKTIQLLEGLIYQFNLKPIIAHIERYPATKYGKDLDLIQKFVDLSCLLQMNVDSLKYMKTRGNCKKLLQGGWIDLLGSDCHSMKNRPPVFDKMYRYAKKWDINLDNNFLIDFG